LSENFVRRSQQQTGSSKYFSEADVEQMKNKVKEDEEYKCNTEKAELKKEKDAAVAEEKAKAETAAKEAAKAGAAAAKKEAEVIIAAKTDKIKELEETLDAADATTRLKILELKTTKDTVDRLNGLLEGLPQNAKDEFGILEEKLKDTTTENQKLESSIEELRNSLEDKIPKGEYDALLLEKNIAVAAAAKLKEEAGAAASRAKEAADAAAAKDTEVAQAKKAADAAAKAAEDAKLKAETEAAKLKKEIEELKNSQETTTFGLSAPSMSSGDNSKFLQYKKLYTDDPYQLFNLLLIFIFNDISIYLKNLTEEETQILVLLFIPLLTLFTQPDKYKIFQVTNMDAATTNDTYVDINYIIFKKLFNILFSNDSSHDGTRAKLLEKIISTFDDDLDKIKEIINLILSAGLYNPNFSASLFYCHKIGGIQRTRKRRWQNELGF
jgi:hypothetical protein